MECGIGISLLVPDESCRTKTAARRAATIRLQRIDSKLSLTGYAHGRAPMRARNVDVWLQLGVSRGIAELAVLRLATAALIQERLRVLGVRPRARQITRSLIPISRVNSVADLPSWSIAAFKEKVVCAMRSLRQRRRSVHARGKFA